MGFSQRISKLLSLICTVLFIAMAVITFVQAINRYILSSSFYWAEEFTRFSLVWLTFLGSSIAVLDDSHTRIDFFINRLPAKMTKIMESIGDLLCLFFIVAISYTSIDFIVLSMKNLSPALKVPMGLVYFALPFSGILMALFFCQRILIRTKEIKNMGGDTQ